MRGAHCSAACTVCDRGQCIKLLAERSVGLAGLLRRFAANGWPITTTTNEGLGVQVKDLIIAAAVSMGTATSANIAGGLLDTYAALQLVPVDPSSSTSTSALSSDFGDTPSSPSPEEANPFASSSATQSGDFGDASSGVAPAPALSTQQQAVSLAVQAAAAAAGNATLNATHSIFGGSQPVVFTPAGSALAPEVAAVLLNSLYIQAPAGASLVAGATEAAFVLDDAPASAPGYQPAKKARKIGF